jgi:hypothetical protein
MPSRSSLKKGLGLERTPREISVAKLQNLLGPDLNLGSGAEGGVIAPVANKTVPSHNTTKENTVNLQDRNRLNYFRSRINADSDPLATDDILLRMLSARENNVKDACVMYERWKAMRVDYNMDTINSSTVHKILQSRVAYLHGVDKEFRPACVLLPRNHHPAATRIDEVIQFALYLMKEGSDRADELIRENNLPQTYGQICVIYDRRGMTRKNFDSRLFGIMKKLVDVVQICYAERLGKIYVMGTNWFFHMMYRIISPLLSEKTRNKIVILRKPEDLLEYFDADQLERERISDDVNYPKW